jgi:hypothetical protein
LSPRIDQIDSDKSTLPIAVRVYPIPVTIENLEKPLRRWWPLPEQVLVFDTETRTDTTQRLTFGSYQSFIEGESVEEGLFHAEDITSRELATLRRYVGTHKPRTAHNGVRELRLLSVSEFLEDVLWLDGYKSRGLLIAFNHPFDLSRLAKDFTDARKPFLGGFSLHLWTFRDENSTELRDQYRPHVDIKHIDAKRAFIGFTARKNPDREDLVPERSRTGKSEKGHKFRGHFLDLRTLAFALTDRGHSLESACEAFGVEHSKVKVKRHGKITNKYIDYNRRDVLASCELADKLLDEYQKHHVSLQVTKAFSPASIGKSYLRDARIDPILHRQPDFPKEFLGYAQSAFYGGRTSAHIRKVPVPVVYTDFLSMYPTVNSLMGLWRFVIAERIEVVKNAQRTTREFLQRILSSPDMMFDPAEWKQLPGFARIIPEDNILPSRSKYSEESNDWQVALNYLSGDRDNPHHALWYALPDVVATVLLTNRIPRIVDAFHISPLGVSNQIKSRIRLRGSVEIDPREQDFFKAIIEQRQLVRAKKHLPNTERERLNKALKVLANATSYGIYAQMDRHESEKKEKVTCYGMDSTPYSCNVVHPEEAGEYCFPPLASLITAAARLMLALLEYSVTSEGGTFAMEDTDSMAIVSTERGGLISCPGGDQKLRGGGDAIKALSWKEVDDISEKFGALNPYDSSIVPGSILKIEDDNHDPKTGERRQIYCLAISAKRYALFLKNAQDEPVLLTESRNNKEDRWSEHGLGHLLNPTDPDSDDRDWISMAWLNIARRSLGLPTGELGFERLPAVGRTSVSSPAIMKPLTALNEGKKYADRIKPFNFLATCHVKAPTGYPIGVDPEQFHLITPYEKDPKRWLKKNWIDQYSGETFRITTAGRYGTKWTARVKTYGEVLEDYEEHPEAKCADSNGNPCLKGTTGLLQRRRIRIDEIRFIGKESNELENVEAGIEQSEQNVYTEYPDPRRDEWTTKILPALKKASLKVLEQECKPHLSRRAIIDLRADRSRPHRKTRELLTVVLEKLGFL